MSERWSYRKDMIEREVLMPNRELLDNVLSMAGGDDYDGCFTEQGQWEFDYLCFKLKERLSKIGWLQLGEEDAFTGSMETDLKIGYFANSNKPYSRTKTHAIYSEDIKFSRSTPLCGNSIYGKFQLVAHANSPEMLECEICKIKLQKIKEEEKKNKNQ